jgi:biopolymer transport protein ExbD
MVDLAFLLITFFMLTTSLNKPHALDVAVPDKNMDYRLDMDERRIINLIINENSYSLIHGNFKNPIKSTYAISSDKNQLKKIDRI